ncbi:aminoacyl-tRNA deacylase [Tundrisphaera sp. TA3]|uniref:aminoacyl-tRNA deacylase n=1 Tax=Tundrisphaera sp. TA3 TaxID=3435775 RepID=UPI003EBADB50
MIIREFLKSRSARFEVFLHRPSHSASHLAESIHVPGRCVAKGVLVRAGEGYALAVLPATHRIDLERLGRTLGGVETRIATEAEVEQIFADCEPGVLPPFGQLYGIATVVDTSLSGGSEIVFVANTTHEGVRMRFRDYEAIESPLKARFAEPISPRRPRSRKAG